MQRVCFTLRVKKDRIDDYLRAHQVWPEMQQAISDAGITNYSMFVREDGLLVGYFEAEDPERLMRELGNSELAQRWEAGMEEYFEKKEGTSQRDLNWLNQYYYQE